MGFASEIAFHISYFSHVDVLPVEYVLLSVDDIHPLSVGLYALSSVLDAKKNNSDMTRTAIERMQRQKDYTNCPV